MIVPTGALPEQLPNERALRKVQELYEGRGRGSQLDSARGTAWGLLNAVTEYTDHHVAYAFASADGVPRLVCTGGSLLYGTTGRTDLISGKDLTDDEIGQVITEAEAELARGES